MQHQSSAQAVEPTVRVRRTGESLLVTSAFISARAGDRLFSGTNSVGQENAQLRTFYRRDFDPERVGFGMIHRIRTLDEGSLDAVVRSLQQEGTALLEPDLIDVAMQMSTARLVLVDSFCLLKANPGPNLAFIAAGKERLRISWSGSELRTVPAETAFLVFTKPH